MAPGRFVREAGLAIFTGSLLVGCIPVYYSYPTVAHVPAVDVRPRVDEVRAFRVDVADQEGCIDFPQEELDLQEGCKRKRVRKPVGEPTGCMSHHSGATVKG